MYKAGDDLRCLLRCCRAAHDKWGWRDPIVEVAAMLVVVAAAAAAVERASSHRTCNVRSTGLPVATPTTETTAVGSSRVVVVEEVTARRGHGLKRCSACLQVRASCSVG
jgi:hypothetical protein